MPEYLAPGVFVEETSFRAKSIQGVGTSTTAFVGLARRGPVGQASDVITSFGEFERIYGGLGDLMLGGGPPRTNHLAHAVRAFFDNGGARLYVARVFSARGVNGGATLLTNSARGAVGTGAGAAGNFRARFPGIGLNGIIVAYEKTTPANAATLNAAPVGSMARTGAGNAAVHFVKGPTGAWTGPAPAAGGGDGGGGGGAAPTINLGNVPADAVIVTLNLELRPGSATRDDQPEGGVIVLERLGFGGGHPRALTAALAQNPTSRAQALAQPYWFDPAANLTPFQLRAALFTAGPEAVIPITLGDDGTMPVATDNSPDMVSYADALAALEEIPDVAIVAAPGHSEYPSFEGAQDALISHAERMRYRIAVLDTPAGQGVGDARAVRARIDSKYAALYYPWVVVPNPAARPSDDTIPKEIALPPSGFICGVYARTDIERGVWKAPANEVVRGALRFEREVSKGEQEVLNPEGINCLRSFFGRGNRVWGARTISSDPEWIYVNVRRYFIYLEHSIDRSTQWAVFEPNGERLWANIRETVSSFLFAEWRSGALLGATPDEAYFVRCDRSTMTQADLDNGRLICEIGVAAIKPAEFVIFRIGQKTADAAS